MIVYDDLAYAQSRLVETIVMHEGKPVRVREVVSEDTVYVVPLLNSEEMIVVPLKSLDINPVKLGYMNGPSDCVYLARTPMRQDWRQGLRPKSMRFIAENMNARIAPNDEAIAKTILGIYPSLKECVAFIKRRKNTISQAFSRNFSTNKDGALWFKGAFIVGEIDDTKQYSLKPKFDWVSEMLEEELAAA